jgi:exopolysaccharide biosynthesis polyprenyl glycosylphosphotransferase
MQIGEPVVDLEVAIGTPDDAEHLPLVPVAVPNPPLVEQRAAAALRAVHVVAAAGRAGAVLMAVVVPYAALRSLTFQGLVGVVVLGTVWLATLRSSRAAGQGMLDRVPTLGIGSATGLVAVAALDPWFPGLQLGPLALLAIAAGVFVSAAVWEAALRRTSVGRRRVLVIGTDDLSEAMAEELRTAGVRNVELVAHVADGEADRPDAEVPLLGGLAELGPIVEAQRPDLVVLTDEETYADAVDRLLDVPAPRFRVVGLAGFFEYVFGRVPIEQVSPAWFMSILHLRQPVYARWTKRTFDVLLAAIGLVVMSPVLLAVALAVRATGRPVLYRQTRVGEGGRLFTIYKFRTMVRDAEANGACFACERDERTTRCGRFLRRAHLDELPQLWNVLKGDMAMVGPRPERPEFVEVLERTVPFWTRRSLVKPGVTGWAQLKCGYAAETCEMAEKLSYDLWYLRHRSLAVDVAICLETIGVELRALLPVRTTKLGCTSAERGFGR